LVAATHIAVPNLNGSYQSDDPGVTQGARNAIKGSDALSRRRALSRDDRDPSLPLGMTRRFFCRLSPVAGS